MDLRSIKTVCQNYQPTDRILELLEIFRCMLNQSIQTGIQENVTSLKALSLRTYAQLKGYAVPSYYKLCAISAATGILKNHRRTIRRSGEPANPHCRRAILTTCYGFKIEDGKLRLPVGRKEYTYIGLNSHTVTVLSVPGLSVKSITLTTSRLSIIYSREVAEKDSEGLLGIDRNLDNITTASSDGTTRVYNLSRAGQIRSCYRVVKSRFSRNDHRMRRRIYAKYGRKEKNKVSQMLHFVSKSVVEEAKKKRFGITMEKLTGIRRLYRRGNFQTKRYRFRLNAWSYGELQRQVEYKARWEGLRIIYVHAGGTSAMCSICGSRLYPNEHRVMHCPDCNISHDRDINAARNILARGLRFGPHDPSVEAMVQERLAKANPESR